MKIHPDQMLSSAGEAEELLKAIANRHRLTILCQLIDGERSVGEMADFLSLRDSTVSQHLALLRKDGLVSTRRDGQTIWYAIASTPARKLLETLYQVYCAPTAICHPAGNKRAASITKAARLPAKSATSTPRNSG
jgi:DNA-binding transcriptional ArsR family regulator